MICEMCEGSGEGLGGYRGICGYCDGTGEGACDECRYPVTQQSPVDCSDHGVSLEGRHQRRHLLQTAQAWGSV